MAKEAQAIEVMQAIVTGLSAQSFNHRLHSKVFASQGFEALGEKYAAHADEEMGFVEQFVDRIIDLGGHVKHEANAEWKVYEDIQEYLAFEKQYSIDGIAAVESMLDPEFDVVTYDLIKDYLKDEVDDLNWTDQQIDLIGYVGIQNWLAKQMTGSGESEE